MAAVGVTVAVGGGHLIITYPSELLSIMIVELGTIEFRMSGRLGGSSMVTLKGSRESAVK
jgi:hypothetical protein